MYRYKKITSGNFRSFGRVIEYPGKSGRPASKNLFRIVISEKKRLGWRIAYLVVRDKKISRLEQHLDTFESFEPVKGKALIYLAKEKDPDRIECFYLDKPIVLYKGVWHGVVALGREAEIKISENFSVKSLYWRLGFELPYLT